MKPKCALIYNEHASGFNKKIFLEIVKAIYNSGFTITTIESEYPEFIIDNIDKFNNDYNVILTMGGDGTVSNAYEAFHRLKGEQKALYGHVPSGTTNDMGENTYVPRYNAPKATKMLLNGEVENRDIISINGHAIAYIGAAGVLAPCTYLIDKSDEKKDIGTLSYIRYGCKAFFNDDKLYKSIIQDPYQVTIEMNGQKFDDKIIFFAAVNGKSFGHLKVNPKANLCNGKFDVLLVHNTKELLYNLIKSPFSANGIMGSKNIAFTTDHLKITFNNRVPYYPINCDGDGRNLMEGTNVFEVKTHGKIKQLVGKKR